MRIFGVILAGGAALRMGGADKALLCLGRIPLITRVQDRLAPQVEHLAISANGDPARFAFTGLVVLPDAVSQGPLSGVLAALDWAAAAGADALATVAVDTPFLPCDLVARLCLAAEASPGGAAVAAADRPHPTCALWPVALRGTLRAYLDSGKSRVMGFADATGTATARFPDQRAFMNLNTPDDLAAAQQAV